MANTDSSYGLRPISRQGSSANSTGTTEYRIAYDNSNPIFHGMAVIPLAGGVIDDLQAAAGGNVSIAGGLADVNMYPQLLVLRYGLTTGPVLARIVIIPSKPSCTTIQINCSKLLPLTL